MYAVVLHEYYIAVPTLSIYIYTLYSSTICFIILVKHDDMSKYVILNY